MVLASLNVAECGLNIPTSSANGPSTVVALGETKDLDKQAFIEQHVCDVCNAVCWHPDLTKSSCRIIESLIAVMQKLCKFTPGTMVGIYFLDHVLKKLFVGLIETSECC